MVTKLGVVIVTYNRIEKLKKALFAYEEQELPCSEMVIVNNASTDGTEDFLNKWENSTSVYNKYVIHLDQNTGGAGGFFTGTKYCSSLDVDWIWLADDDAYPNSKAFLNFYNFCKNHDPMKYSAICGAVYNNGRPDLMHRRLLSYKYGMKPIMTLCNGSLYEKEYFKIDILSYVGAIINNIALKKIGFCKKEFFIYYDDSEHSLRLAKYGPIICVPIIQIEHDSDANFKVDGPENIISWKAYYGIRNQIVMYKEQNYIAAMIISLMCIKSEIINIIKGKNRNFKYLKLLFTAIIDAWSEKLGIHGVYKPGFFIKR